MIFILLGKTVYRYDYSLPVFDEKGKEIIMEFDGGKKLRKDAFIHVFRLNKSSLD
ncbi:YxeA family protein [Bacillus gaemokensis]|uniref:YxeA family protein n=1 Tax=Bacillus gaemokensis TaxID=574375 RepID=UPI0009E5CFDA